MVKLRAAALLLALVMICGLACGCGPQAEYLIGDVNGDGEVDARDVLLLQQYLLDPRISVSEKNSDLTFDNTVNQKDIEVLLEYLAGVSQPGNRYSSILLNGEDIASYQIVHPAAEEGAPFAAWAGELLQAYIENCCGVQLALVTDDKKETDYEILIGKTNRKESEWVAPTEPLSYLTYADGKKIVFGGEGFLLGGGVGYLTHIALDNTLPWNGATAIQVPEEQTVRYYTPVAATSVILIIGDGMGENHIRMACDAGAAVIDPGTGERLFLEQSSVETFWAYQFPTIGQAATNNYEGTVTDSAASATALSTGWKTLNGVLGMRPDDFLGDGVTQGLRSVQNVRELAELSGRSTAILSSDKLNGATPNGFLVHHSYRYDTSIVLEQQAALEGGRLECDYLWCSYDSDDLLEKLREAFLTVSANNTGFFMMAEEAMIDKYASKLNFNEVVRTVSRLNDTVAYAALCAVAHPDLAVIVTADHETGGLTIQADGSYLWTSDGEHTAAPVPVYAIGSGTEIFHSTVSENTEIAKYIASVFGTDAFGG